MPTGGIVAIVLAAVSALFVVVIYNNLVEVRNNIGKAWKNIDVLLLQRHDELSKLVEVCRGYMKHESELLDRLTKLRVGYDEAGDANEKVRIENEINRATLRLRHVWEGYPDLKASANFLSLQNAVSKIEERIADRREFLNDAVNIYNIRIEQFPDMLVARLLGYARKDFLEVPAEAAADVPMRFATEAD